MFTATRRTCVYRISMYVCKMAFKKKKKQIKNSMCRGTSVYIYHICRFVTDRPTRTERVEEFNLSV